MSYQRLRDDVTTPAAAEKGAAGDGPRSASRELFDEDAAQLREQNTAKPWWQTNFFVRSPTLFGTWDGVFTTVMINIFGVMIFLRMGWMVGYAGVGLSMLIIFLTLTIGAITVMSIIGLITRHVEHTCLQQALADETLQAYDVFAMIGFVLGQRISGAVGLVYAFGHAVGVAMYAVGLGEAMSELFHWSGPWPVRGVAMVTAFILLLVVMAGVRWVVKLQLVLMVVLGIAILDFVLGTMVRRSPANGVLGYSAELLHNNTSPAFTPQVNFYKVFGVFFPTITGIAGGLNMACDLRTPARSVPIGSAAALGVSSVSWIAMVIMLGATCTKASLQADSLIEYRVSLVGALFLIGLYVSSLSSCLAVFYGAPRVLQSMGRAKIVPLLSVIGRGRGANQEPVVAILVVGAVAFVFIFIGHLNTLAMVISMPFLLTYAVLNYAYFALAQSDDGVAVSRDGGHLPLSRLNSLYHSGAGDHGDGDEGTTAPPEPKAPVLGGDVMETTEVSHGNGPTTKRRSPSAPTEHDLLLQQKTTGQHEQQQQRPMTSTSTAATSSSTQKSGSQTLNGVADARKEPSELDRRIERVQQFLHITAAHRRRQADFSLRILNRLVSRWVSLLGSLLCVVAMFVIHWGFALAAVCMVLVLFIYIGQANPSVLRGESSFVFTIWIPELLRRLASKLRPASLPPVTPQPATNRSVIITQPAVPFDLNVVQLTREGQDYSQRERVHHSVRQSQLASEFCTSPPPPSAPAAEQ